MLEYNYSKMKSWSAVILVGITMNSTAITTRDSNMLS